MSKIPIFFQMPYKKLFLLFLIGFFFNLSFRVQGANDCTEGVISIENLKNNPEKLKNQINILTSERDFSIKGQNQTKFNCINKKISEYQDALTKIESCKESVKDMKSSGSEFNKSCATFSGGKTKCAKNLHACEMCPSQDSSDEDYNCIKIHKTTQCPALSGNDLKTAKKNKEDYKKEIQEINTDIKELTNDISEKKDELNGALAELENSWQDITKELSNKTDNENALLEEGLKKGKRAIKDNLNKQLAQSQLMISKSLKTAHSFENALTSIQMDYLKEQKKLFLECKVQAQARLAEYRKKRKRAIKTGTYKISIYSFLQKGRTSFAQKDQARLKRYTTLCHSQQKLEFQFAKTKYKQKLRILEQQKLQYLQSLNQAKQKMLDLNQQALDNSNQLVKDYTKEMTTLLTRSKKAYQAELNKYSKNKMALSSKSNRINHLQSSLSYKQALLKEINTKLIREKEVLLFLDSKGVKVDSEDSYKEAIEAYEDYKNNTSIAKGDCDCANNPNNRECQKISRAEDNLVELSNDSNKKSSFKKRKKKGRK